MDGGAPQPAGVNLIHLETGQKEVEIFIRRNLLPGQGLIGPALIVDDYTTVLLGEGWRLSVDTLLNLIIER